MSAQTDHPEAGPHDSSQSSFLRADKVQETDRTSHARSGDSATNGVLHPLHYFEDPRPAPKPPRRDSFCDVADRAVREHMSNAAYGQSVRSAELISAKKGDAINELNRDVLRRSTSFTLRKAFNPELTHAQHEEDIRKFKARFAKEPKKVLRAYGKVMKLSREIDDSAVVLYAGT